MKRKDCSSPISFALDSSICRIGAERLDASDVFLVLLCDSGGFGARVALSRRQAACTSRCAQSPRTIFARAGIFISNLVLLQPVLLH